MKHTLLVLVSAATVCALGCKSKSGDKQVKPAPGAVDTGSSSAPAIDAAAAAGKDPLPLAAGRDVVVASASLPYGQLAQIGGVKLAHPFEIVTQTALTADGAISASGSYVRAWDRNGNLRWQAWSPGRLSRFAISPDGARIAVARSDSSGGRVTVHDRAGKAGASFETGRVEGIAWSPDGAKLLLAGTTVAIHNAATGATVSSLKARPAIVGGFATDGSIVFVARDGVYRWSGAADAAAEAIVALAAPPTAVAVAPDGATVWWSDGKAVTAVDAKTKAATPIAVTAGGTIAALTVQGTTIAVSWKGGLRVWDAGATPTQRWERPVKLGTVPVVGFAADGKTVAVSDVRSVVIADAATGRWTPSAPSASFKGFTAASLAEAAMADGRFAFDLTNGLKSSATDERPGGAPAWVDKLAVDAKGTVLGWSMEAADHCAALKVWIANTGERTIRKPSRCTKDGARTWQVGPSLIADSAGEIIAPESGKPLVTLRESVRPLIAIATSSDRSHAVAVYGPLAGSSDGNDTGTLIDLYELAGGTMVHETRLNRADDTAVSQVAVLNDGTAYLGCRDGVLLAVVQGVDAGEPTARFNSSVTSIETAPSGKVVAVTDADDRTVIFGAP